MIGPQVFRASDAPRYIRGLIVVASMLALVFVLCLCWLMYLIAENRRRRKRLAEMGASEEERLLKNKINGELDVSDPSAYRLLRRSASDIFWALSFEQMTDNKNIYFLYAW
jgi:hypothetical protein